MTNAPFTNYDEIHDEVMKLQPLGNELMMEKVDRGLLCDATFLFILLWFELAKEVSGTLQFLLVVVGRYVVFSSSGSSTIESSFPLLAR